MKVNYQKELEQILAGLEKTGRVPRLLLHSCCAPCSSYVLEYLSEYFQITVLYYNPNIWPEEEYGKRVAEQQRLAGQMKTCHPVTVQAGEYEKEKFYAMSRGLETEKEGGERCFRCYRLRLEETARRAAEGGYDYFTTTLSISPMKNAAKLNETGQELAELYGVPYLVSDFKKRDGYRRSVELSREYGLYRQDYCGCVYSKREREQRERENLYRETSSVVH